MHPGSLDRQRLYQPRASHADGAPLQTDHGGVRGGHASADRRCRLPRCIAACNPRPQASGEVLPERVQAMCVQQVPAAPSATAFLRIWTRCRYSTGARRTSVCLRTASCRRTTADCTESHAAATEHCNRRRTAPCLGAGFRGHDANEPASTSATATPTAQCADGLIGDDGACAPPSKAWPPDSSKPVGDAWTRRAVGARRTRG